MTRFRLAPLLALAAGACGPRTPPPPPATLPPPAPPAPIAPLIGEYAQGPDTLSVLEDGGGLYLLFWQGPGWPGEPDALVALDDSTYLRAARGDTARFRRGTDGRVQLLALEGRELARASLGGEEGSTFRILPLRPPEELRAEALAATPPEEEGEFLPSDLVELVPLDPTLRLDVRYASTNNFMGEVFYSSPRVFLQRPAAQAVVRANAWLRERGYGLLLHDGYRPWYVTKMFWDATPEPLRDFVADPASGSRHNRGCAVDLTLFDLATGEAVVMPAGFDEMSPRSYGDYPGGTSRQRWLRQLLKEAMEAQGFTVYPGEWWHFDYQDWRRYRIENRTFEEMGEERGGAG